MNSESLYLRDALDHLISEARRAREATRESTSVGDKDSGYRAGRAMAYYEVVSYLVQQIDAFQLSREVFKLKDFDPEVELL